MSELVDPSPPAASEGQASTSTSSVTDDIRKQVENEQALSDSQKRVKELTDEIEQIKQRITAAQGEREGASKLKEIQ